MKDIIEHIAKARNEAFKRAIVANTVVVNEDIAVSNGFYFPTSDHSYLEMPPMVMGMKVAYDKNSLPDNIAFAISEDKRVADNKLEQLRLIEEELDLQDFSFVKFLKAVLFGIYKTKYKDIYLTYDISPSKLEYDNKRKCFVETIQDMGASWEELYYLSDYGETWVLTKEELQ